MKKHFILISIFLAGSAGAWAAPGDLDTSFGTNGVVKTDIGGFQNFLSGIAVQGDGKIVVSGTAGGFPAEDFAVLRYDTDGALDNSFGTNGIQVTDLSPNRDNTAGLLIQPDGKIVVGGTTEPSVGEFDLAIVRYNTDGSPDDGFGTNGVAAVSLPGTDEFAWSVARRSDGSLVIGGYTQDGGGDTSLLLARVSGDGTLDTSFGTNGLFAYRVEGQDSIATDMAIQGDDSIVVSVTVGSGSGDRAAMIRVTPGGDLDTAFGTNGEFLITTATDRSTMDSVALQVDGKIICGGSYTDTGTAPEMLLVRLTKDGELDAGFGSNGIVRLSRDPDGFETTRVVLQDDGYILAAATYFSGFVGGDLSVSRFDPTGAVDTAFGTDGFVTNDSGLPDSSTAAALQDDGRILAGGWNDDHYFIRLMGNTADLTIAKTCSPSEAKVGDTIDCTVTVANAGPDVGPAVVTDVLPSALKLDEASLSGQAGVCEVDGSLVCHLGAVAAGSDASLNYSVTAESEGTVQNVATLSGRVVDDQSDNTAGVSLTIKPAGGGGCALVRD